LNASQSRQVSAGAPALKDVSSPNSSVAKGWTGWFRKTAQPTPSEEEQPLAQPRDTFKLQQEYQDMVRERCARHGINVDAVRVEAVSLGYRHGREVYIVLVRAKEDVATALQVAFFAPAIEKKVGAEIRTTWIGDYTHFAGVWTQWPSQLNIPEELGALLCSMRQRPGAAAQGLSIPQR
jgi:hypothetical protein